MKLRLLWGSRKEVVVFVSPFLPSFVSICIFRSPVRCDVKYVYLVLHKPTLSAFLAITLLPAGKFNYISAEYWCVFSTLSRRQDWNILPRALLIFLSWNHEWSIFVTDEIIFKYADVENVARRDWSEINSEAFWKASDKKTVKAGIALVFATNFTFRQANGIFFSAKRHEIRKYFEREIGRAPLALAPRDLVDPKRSAQYTLICSSWMKD